VIPSLSIRLPASQTRLTFDLSWLAIMPAGVWAIASSYVAVIGAFLSPARIWEVALLCILGAGFSLVCHVLAHSYAAHLARHAIPPAMPVLPFGDAGQAWLPAATAWGEVFVSAAGPLANLVLGGLAFLVWNAQPNAYLDIISPFIAGFNAWLVVINAIPAFPFDGGRLARVILGGILRRPSRAYQLVRLSGYLIPAGLAGWAIFLVAQKSRYSWSTSGVTLSFAVLIVLGLLAHTPTQMSAPVAATPGKVRRLAGLLLGGLALLLMAGAGSTLLMTNNGLDAPGVALSVEPMVEVPAQYRHTPKGTFLLTAVFSQAPVPAAGWYLAELTPVVKLLPPEKIAPNQTSPQESARQGFQMLDQSETVAAAVGVRLAGYPTEITGQGARVDSILPESLANDRLHPGDVITTINGQPVNSATNLINLVKVKNPDIPVDLQILRGGNTMDVKVGLLPPLAAGGPPRIGISIEDAGFDYRLPFPVKIVPQKIVGGPSAGLMFTLTVYNLLSPVDLTGGHKIAGTGTISPDGSVGPIGGVEQKVAAAEMAGAEYFFAPADNYADALKAARRIKVIKIETVEQAVAFLHSLPPK
jgi:PDZ domain-containing protein